MIRRRVGGLLALVVGLCAGRVASAQGCFAVGGPLFRDFSLGAPLFGDTVVRGTVVRDTLHRDTTKTKPLVTWADSDSVIARLLARPGYHAIRYQGDQVTFDAQRRNLRIVGVPAAVQRVQALVVGDTIIYNDSTRVIVALGDTVILHDPAQQSADVVARGRIVYNVGERRGAVTNISTSVVSGAQYYISGKNAAFVGDTTRNKASTFYVRNGIITSCDDSLPDYYFQAHEIKYVSKHLIVARPAVLYVAGVPVFWLPFLFQDIRSGRQSGLLTPRFGISEFVRTSSAYRRHVENLGYYANLGDYMDALGWIDWRSGAGSTTGDPGFTRVNGEFRYHWLDRFMTGRLAVNHLSEGDGSTNTAFSWFHNQDFSQTSHLAASVNYVTNTTVQRTTVFDPQAVLATIRSDVRYSRTLGPFSLDVGGTRTQYPGRSQVDEGYPNVSLSSPTLALAKWLDWTPGFNYTRQATLNNDQVGTFAYRYFTNASGQLDSARTKSSSNNSSLNFNTPFSILGFQISANIGAQSQQNNFPITRTFVDTTDTTQRITRTYARSYLQGVDWNVGFSLPSFLNNSFRVRPDVFFQNVAGGSYWVRSELSGGQFVHQSKRVSTGISLSPTLFALFPGFGPLERIRHSITPSFRFSYSPAATVNPEYLRALNQSPSNFIAGLPQSQVSMSLSQVFEGKFQEDTSGKGEARKLRLLTLNMSPLVYDFERAHKTHHTGLVTDHVSYDLASDLLPGFSLRSDYSLFQGDINSDTARFSPFRESVSAAFTLNGESGIIGAIGRLFGRKPPPSSRSTQSVPADTLGMAQSLTSFPAAGIYSQNRQYQIPETQTWTASITFSSNRQRPPKGGRVLAFDPATYCNQYLQITPPNLAGFDVCKQQVLLNPPTTTPFIDPIAGGAFVSVPPRENVGINSSFHITPNWLASWETVYDAVNKNFASQQVTLQRELHDWRAVFSFTSSPNGNFYFSFYIANKAQPELRFPYNRSTYRQPSVP